MHSLTTCIRWLFSRDAATRSLSFSCLLMAFSDECVPGVISTVILKRGGRARRSLTLMLRPMRVAMEQCCRMNNFIKLKDIYCYFTGLTGIVGVNCTKTSPLSLFTMIRLCSNTWSSSRDSGCSGSLIFLIKSWIQTLIKRESRNFVILTKNFSFIDWIHDILVQFIPSDVTFICFLKHVRVNVLQFSHRKKLHSFLYFLS